MEYPHASPPIFDLDSEGQVQIRWTRGNRLLQEKISIDDALDLQHELATFLAQVELEEWREQAASCECEIPAELEQLASQSRFLN